MYELFLCVLKTELLRDLHKVGAIFYCVLYIVAFLVIFCTQVLNHTVFENAKLLFFILKRDFNVDLNNCLCVDEFLKILLYVL